MFATPIWYQSKKFILKCGMTLNCNSGIKLRCRSVIYTYITEWMEDLHFGSTVSHCFSSASVAISRFTDYWDEYSQCADHANTIHLLYEGGFSHWLLIALNYVHSQMSHFVNEKQIAWQAERALDRKYFPVLLSSFNRL